MKDVARIVEGKLYAWALMHVEYPQAAISGAYQDEPHRSTRARQKTDSLQERWAVRYQDELQGAAVIERVLRRMSHEQRRLVELRYVERWPWRKVAQKIHVSERTVYTMRDHVLMIFSYEFGLLRDHR